jgi:hypothetical protein
MGRWRPYLARPTKRHSRGLCPERANACGRRPRLAGSLRQAVWTRDTRPCIDTQATRARSGERDAQVSGDDRRALRRRAGYCLAFS